MSGENDIPSVEVARRPALDLEAAHKVTGRTQMKERESLSTSLKQWRRRTSLRPKSWTKFFHHYLPITNWLFNYKWKEDLLADVIGGVTIAVMHIPQGMAYASLAESPPVMGIYTAIFPVAMYVLLGPSKHVSIGCLLVIIEESPTGAAVPMFHGTLCLPVSTIFLFGPKGTNPLTSILLGSIVNRRLGSSGDNPVRSWLGLGGLGLASPWSGSEAEAETGDQGLSGNEAVPIVITVTLLAGLWQVLLSLLNLGQLSWVMSDVMVSAYTCSAGVHVVVSQLKAVFGIDLESHSGPLNMFYTIAEIFERIEETNVACVIISVIAILVLVVNDEVIKPRLAKYCPFPVPIQLMVVVVSTIIGFAVNIDERWDVPIVTNMTQGFPSPVVPPTSMFSSLVLDSLIVAVVGYSVTLSMAKLYAAKIGYDVDANQELLSEGVSNTFGCFFSCLPASASMSRTSVQVNVGGRTQLLSVVSIAILVVVIMFATQLFYYLPLAILAAIILVALKTMLFQVQDLPRFWRVSRLDGMLWVGIFAANILLDIDLGLIVGVALNLIVLVYRGNASRVNETILLDSSGLSVELSPESVSLRRPGTVILSVTGVISYANFADILDKIRRRLKDIDDKDKEVVILDVSHVAYADQTGATAFKNWVEDKKSRRYAAGAAVHLENMLLRVGVPKDKLFPTVSDALVLVRSKADCSDTNDSNGVTKANGEANTNGINGHEAKTQL